MEFWISLVELAWCLCVAFCGGVCYCLIFDSDEVRR